MSKKPLELRQARNFGQSISDSFRFLQEHFRPLVSSVLVTGGIFLVFEMLVTYAAHRKAASDFHEYGTVRINYSGTAALIKYGTALLFSTMATLSVTAYMMLCLERKNAERPTLTEIWAYVNYYLWRVGGVSLLLSLIQSLGLLLCLVPGLWLLPYLCLFPAVMMIENTSFVFAYERVVFLVKNAWWEVFSVLIIFGLLIMAPAFLSGVISGIFLGLSGYFSTTQVGDGLFIAINTLQVLFQLIWILPIIAAVFCYLNLVERKESTGMMERIAALDDPANDAYNEAHDPGFNSDLEEQF
ncbi:MAG: hypothetical protein INR69_12515 [Mucilaginibacter polytrichastri]|nr:hypothetical protein [Mucilaginibacter polytrichastri]